MRDLFIFIQFVTNQLTRYTQAYPPKPEPKKKTREEQIKDTIAVSIKIGMKYPLKRSHLLNRKFSIQNISNFKTR